MTKIKELIKLSRNDRILSLFIYIVLELPWNDSLVPEATVAVRKAMNDWKINRLSPILLE